MNCDMDVDTYRELCYSSQVLRLKTSQFKRLRSRPLVSIEIAKTLRMRYICEFIFVLARNQIYIFGPLKLIIIPPHTYTHTKPTLRVKATEREIEREG